MHHGSIYWIRQLIMCIHHFSMVQYLLNLDLWSLGTAQINSTLVGFSSAFLFCKLSYAFSGWKYMELAG